MLNELVFLDKRTVRFEESRKILIRTKCVRLKQLSYLRMKLKMTKMSCCFRFEFDDVDKTETSNDIIAEDGRNKVFQGIMLSVFPYLILPDYPLLVHDPLLFLPF